MTMVAERPGQWMARCDGCDAVTGVIAASASSALRDMGDLGWCRPRPGFADYCAVCLGEPVAE